MNLNALGFLKGGMKGEELGSGAPDLKVSKGVVGGVIVKVRWGVGL